MKDWEIKKLYYSISEVSKMLGLETYVLRYWETEFEQLRPKKNRAGNRIYTEKDIEIIKLIKKLTREDRYTTAGARQVLNQMVEENGDLVAAAETANDVQVAMSAGGSELVNDLRTLRSSLVEMLRKLSPETDE